MQSIVSRIAVVALLSWRAAAPAFASTNATVTIGGAEQQLSGSWDTGLITVAFNGFMETVYYGQYSSPASVASALAAMFSRDYISSGLCAAASGSAITFHLKGTAVFGQLSVSGPTTSFQLSPGAGWPSTPEVSVADTGTIQLTVNGVVAAITKYDEGSTPETIVAGLVRGIQSNSPVNLTETEGALFMQAKTTGSGTDYSYTLETTSWNSANFPQPSFLSTPVSGSLSGGANASSGGGTVYSYSLPSGSYDGVGNVVSYTDSVMGSWGFGYDPLNRLTGAAAGSNAPSGLANDYGCWSYDAFGNRDTESISSTQCANNPPLTNWANYSTNNQFTNTSQDTGGVSYDAAGDLTADGVNTYLYDGEGRVCAVKSQPIPGTYTLTGYVYDAEGNRVAKGTITAMSCDPGVNGFQATNDYVRGPGGEQLTETGSDGQGNMVWAHTNVYADGRLMATYNPDGLHFHLTDLVGTRRVQTDYEGVVEQTCASLPYGDGESCAAGPTEQLYAGLEHDDETGLDHAMYRQYASAMGRWIVSVQLSTRLTAARGG